MRKRVMWILIGVLIVLIAILSFLNMDNVPVNFGFTVVQWPLILIIVGSFIIGVFTAGLLAMIRDIRYTRQIKKLEQKLQTADDAKKEEVEKAEY